MSNLSFPARPHKEFPKAQSLISKQEKDTITIYSDAFGMMHLEQMVFLSSHRTSQVHTPVVQNCWATFEEAG